MNMSAAVNLATGITWRGIGGGALPSPALSACRRIPG
jgi:hypothetical protein